MDPKSILAVMPESAHSPIPAMTAIDFARRFDGYAECLLLGDEPQPYSMLPSQTGSASQLVAAQAAAAANENRREARLEALRTTVEQACRNAGVAIFEYEEAHGNGHIRAPAATLRTVRGRASELAGRCARACDLVVMAAPDSIGTREIAEAALLGSGRPVLLLPAEPHDPIGGHAMIAWDPSAEAWHAVSAALPFLEQAKSVTIAIVGTKRLGHESTRELVDYLHRHGIEATPHVTEAKGTVAETLLDLAEGREADLLVMGGYSHSRLREALIGGTTRYVLSHPGGTPVLMAH